MAKKSRLARIRDELIEQQGGLCCWCHQPFTATGPKQATLEHLKPKMRNGTNSRENLAAAHLHCNQHRGHQMNMAKLQKEKAAKAVEACE
ncbi:HNH endonuclease [Mesorhizobium sp. WSM4313]|uniref:HNH endonuclease n=1 Tax=Mesorhizobium sp. WSM4313 TaxID=2029412 RepID=UPI00159689D6|nr:HNH endonuclease [Mesorhizobium sp. WSM4313]